MLAAAAAAVLLAERNVRVRGRSRVLADRSLAFEPGAGVESVEVAAQDGVTLRGWLLRPEQWSGEAAMVLHGFVDSRVAMESISPRMVVGEIAVRPARSPRIVAIGC